LVTLRETQQEFARSDAYKAWVSERIETLKSRVNAFDILRYNNVDLKSEGDRAEQIHCPFHGTDNKPSARVYPGSGTSPSGVWCYTCRERWDIFKLWKKFEQREDMRFTEVLLGLERAFGVLTPDMPQEGHYTLKAGPSEEEIDAKDLLQVCERRLRQNRDHFKPNGFFLLGHLLDELHAAYESKSVPTLQIIRSSQAILDKIGSKVRVEDDFTQYI